MPDLLITDIDDKLAKQIEQLAAAAGMSVEEWCRIALRRWHEREGRADLERGEDPGVAGPTSKDL